MTSHVNGILEEMTNIPAVSPRLPSNRQHIQLFSGFDNCAFRPKKILSGGTHPSFPLLYPHIPPHLPHSLPSCVCQWTRIIDVHFFSCIPIDPLIETSLICSLLLDIPPHPPSSCLFLFQTLTGGADFGSLLFSPNPLPDLPPSQIYKDFTGKCSQTSHGHKDIPVIIYIYNNIYKT